MLGSGRVTQATVAAWLRESARPQQGRVRHLIAPGLDLVVSFVPNRPGVWRWRGQPKGRRPDGRRWNPVVVTLGDTATVSLPEALHEATRLRLAIQRGADPAADRKAAIQARHDAAVAAQARLTCRQALELYRSALHGRGTLSPRHLNNEVGQPYRGIASVDLLEAATEAITPATVELILARTPPGTRSARFAALDRFLRWANRRADPSTGTPAATALLARHEKPKPLAPRTRVLSATELAAIWCAAEHYSGGGVASALVRFLVTTPCRESEAARMQWGHLDVPGTRHLA